MPWEWDIDPQRAPVSSGAFSHAAGDPPLAKLHLWPYRSLPRRGFAAVIGLTFLGFLIPLFAFIGTVSLWWLLPFAMAALWALWYFIERSYRDGEVLEELTIWRDHMTLTHTGPGKTHHEWEANPYWVTLHMHETGGPVPHYLTLKGGAREVELGRFLSEDERPALYRALLRALAEARRPTGDAGNG